MISIASSQLMKQPMYFFLRHLSLADLCYTSSVTPKLIADLLAAVLVALLVTMAAWHSSSPCTSLRGWGLHPHGDGLWLPCGHLQASVLHSDHDRTEVRCHDRCFLHWGLPAFLRSVSPGHLFTLLWPQQNRSLLLRCVSFAETGLHWHHQNRSPCHCQFGPHGPGDFCGLVDILCYDLIHCQVLLCRELLQSSPPAVPTSLW